MRHSSYLYLVYSLYLLHIIICQVDCISTYALTLSHQYHAILASVPMAVLTSSLDDLVSWDQYTESFQHIINTAGSVTNMDDVRMNTMTSTFSSFTSATTNSIDIDMINWQTIVSKASQSAFKGGKAGASAAAIQVISKNSVVLTVLFFF